MRELLEDDELILQLPTALNLLQGTLQKKKKKKSDNNYANHTADTAIIMTVSTFIICFGGVQSGCVKAQATYTLSSGHCVTHHNV